MTARRRRAGRLPGWIALLALLPALIVSQAAPAPGAAQSAEIELELVASGLDAPVFVTDDGNVGRLYVVERPGRIRVIVNGQSREQPFLDITDRVQSDDSEQGLLGLAFHPDYVNNGRFYVMYTANDWANTVERFEVSSDPLVADEASGQVVLSLPDRAPNHNGGMVAFGPDGMLYVGTGDEGGANDTYENAQRLGSLFGKLLRLDVDGGEPYRVPEDNPFTGLTGARGEVWASGLRNPWRFSFDRQTGDLWLGDVGQATREEVNHVTLAESRGANFGWPIYEGTACVEGPCDPDGYVFPVAEYGHDEGCAVTGGYVQRGAVAPALNGRYFFGDNCSGRIWSLDADDPEAAPVVALDSGLSVSSFGEDSAGNVYVVDLDGEIYRIVAAGGPGPVEDDPAFRRVWERTDGPVASGAVDRTWMWGPAPFTTGATEEYAEAPGGLRNVQYHDKARMEVTNPDGDPDALWHVTNGLLVVELTTGKLQLGDDSFEPRAPADLNVAGDPDGAARSDSPTYATIGRLRDAAPLTDGAVIVQRLARDGTVTEDPALAAYGATAAHRVSVPGIEHQVASPFWAFMNSRGLVLEDGALVMAPLFENPFYATGYPISEAYWATVLVGGTPTDVLLQCFERRCLTWTPDNPEGWQVEAGNVGRHYHEWRYGRPVPPTGERP